MLCVFVARVQRRQLDRDAVAHQRAAAGVGGCAGPFVTLPRDDGADRLVVRPEVTQRVALGARTFAKHVERKAQARQLAPLRRGLVSASSMWRPSTNVTQQLDRAHGGDHRLRAGARATRAARRRRATSAWPIRLHWRTAQPATGAVIRRRRRRSRHGPTDRLSTWRSRRPAHAAALRPDASRPSLRRC